MVTAQQGDVHWVRFGAATDSGPAGKRPAVVIQNDLLNRSNIRTTVVVLLTSNLRLGAVPGNVRLKKGMANLPKASVAVVSQIATVGKGRLLEKIGTLRRQMKEEIVRGCVDVISLA